MNNIKENIMKYIFFIAAAVSVVAVALICIFLFGNGFPAIKKIGIPDFIMGTEWRPGNEIYGIFPMILGSIYVTAGSLMVGVPTAILTAVFISGFCPKKLYKPIKQAIDLMAGIPSVIYGFFGITVIVPLLRICFGFQGMGIISASLLLGIMILPTIISVAEASLSAVPKSYYEGGLALGASPERSFFFVVLPAAKSGIFAAIVLGIGRSIGETMAVIMVAGNQPLIPDSLLSGIRTMTANIVLEMGYASGLHREALIGTAAVLFVFILIINFIFAYFKSRGERP